MPVNAVPTLSASGWAADVAEKVDRLLAYYFTSDFSQSTIYQGSVLAMQYQAQQHGRDPSTLGSVVQDELRTYLNSYFDTAVVQTRITDKADDGTNRYNVHCFATVTQNGTTYSVAKVVMIQDSKIVRYFDFNNNVGND